MIIPREDFSILIHILTNQPYTDLNSEELSYIAGFLDGDGCITAQIVKKQDYVLKYQIRVSIIFYQKNRRVYFLKWLKSKIGVGTIRSKTSDNVSEYTIVGIKNVVPVLQLLESKLHLKREQANLVLKISELIPQIKNNKEKFILLCEMVDIVGRLNDSKTRKISALTVKQLFENEKVPVETEIVSLDENECDQDK